MNKIDEQNNKVEEDMIKAINEADKGDIIIFYDVFNRPEYYLRMGRKHHIENIIELNKYLKEVRKNTWDVIISMSDFCLKIEDDENK